MFRKIGLALSLTSIMNSAAYAAEPGRFTFLEEGEPAPFRVTCFDDVATSKIVTWQEFIQKEFELKHEYELKTLKAQHNLEIQNLQISLDVLQDKYDNGISQRDAEIDGLRTIIAKNKKVNVPLVIVGSVLGGVAVGFAGAYAIDKFLGQ